MTETRAAALIKRHEGCRFVVYDDATGKNITLGVTVKGTPTIGYGRSLNRPISQKQADAFFEADWFTANNIVHEWATEVGAELPPPDSARYGALVNMAYNLGRYRFRGFHKMLAAVYEGKWGLAAGEALDSLWAKQVGERAEELAAMLHYNTWPKEER